MPQQFWITPSEQGWALSSGVEILASDVALSALVARAAALVGDAPAQVTVCGRDDSFTDIALPLETSGVLLARLHAEPGAERLAAAA